MVDVVTARQQIVAGKNYALCLRIKDKKMDAHPRLVMTKIYKPSGKPYQIKSWTRVNNCTSDE